MYVRYIINIHNCGQNKYMFKVTPGALFSKQLKLLVVRVGIFYCLERHCSVCCMHCRVKHLLPIKLINKAISFKHIIKLYLIKSKYVPEENSSHCLLLKYSQVFSK